ncbi:MAG: nucleotide exchange factor GrpE [Aggregatilineales bacterium]
MPVMTATLILTCEEGIRDVVKENKSSAADAEKEFEEMIKNAADGKSSDEPIDGTDAIDDSAEGTHAEAETTAESAHVVNDSKGVPNIETLIAESQKNLEGWQRERAEFQNYKRRIEREVSENRSRMMVESIVKILPIIDDFERAIDNIPDDLKENPWVNGTAMIGRKFDRLLEENDIQILDPVGEPFDPNRHEAVGMDFESDVESGHVTATLQKGYIRGDRVLRPALVRVAN